MHHARSGSVRKPAFWLLLEFYRLYRYPNCGMNIIIYICEIYLEMLVMCMIRGRLPMVVCSECVREILYNMLLMYTAVCVCVLNKSRLCFIKLSEYPLRRVTQSMVGVYTAGRHDCTITLRLRWFCIFEQCTCGERNIFGLQHVYKIWILAWIYYTSWDISNEQNGSYGV